MLVLAGSAVCADKRTNTPVRARAGARVRMFISSATARARARPRGRAPHASMHKPLILCKYGGANTCLALAAAALAIPIASDSLAGVVEHPSAATGDTPCGTLFASEAPSLNTFPHGWRLASQGSATGLDSNGGLDNSKQYYFLFLQTRMTVTAFFVCGRCSS